MAAVGIPIAASVLGGAMSSQGAKKAAKSSKPQIPGIFAGPAATGANIANWGMQGMMPGYSGPFTQPLNPLQNTALAGAGQLLGAGANGFQNALSTVNNAASLGFNPADLQLAQQYTQPFFDFQRQQGLAGVREGAASRGSFYGTGGVNAESLFNASQNANQSQQLLPLAMQMSQYRLGAAQSLPQMLMGQLGLLSGAYGMGEQARGVGQSDVTARYQDYIRNSPQSWMSALAGLMGGTPFYNPAVAPNAMMGVGSALGSLGSSPGFMNILQNYFSPKPSGTP